MLKRKWYKIYIIKQHIDKEDYIDICIRTKKGPLYKILRDELEI